MGHAHSSNGLVASESKLSLLRRKVSTLDTRSSRGSTSERWRQSETNSSKHKFTKLGSIRRRLVRKTRKGSDYRKHIRDLLQSWSSKEIQSFSREYDALDALRDLQRLSDAARIKSSKLQTDMANLYESKYCCDLEIEFQDVSFHVHKAILCARWKSFNAYLEKAQSSDHIRLSEEDFDYPSSIFSSLLKYIYSGYTKDRHLIEVLSNLGEKFGTLNSLDNSMREIIDDDTYTDLILVFPNTNQVIESNIENDEPTIDNTFEVACHSSILCARSVYFRSVLVDKFKNHDSMEDKPVKLVLSEKIIPRTYIKVILHCMYTDCVDLSSVIKWKVADDGSGEADRLLTTVELAMELYEIGHFLDFPILMEACEDMIVENLNVSTLLAVYDWSSQPFGSKYVYRQANYYFIEEFCTLCKVPIFLANIPKKFLLSVIKSDFLQANEEYILAIVIKWGEWQIAKSNEKPGTSPANSLPRRSPKRRDINNDALREIITDLLAHVRLRHVLPTSSPTLQSAYQRRLLQHPFPFDFVATEKRPPSMVFWLREYRHSDYIRPRLFLPYVDEVKLILHERLTAESCHSSSSSLPSQCMPDMLPCNYTGERSVPSYDDVRHRDSVSSVTLDITHLDPHVMRRMLLREKELKTSAEVLRAFALAPDNAEISSHTELRVVREFGFPDELASHIFKQNPDLIEIDSSSGSSKQSTLSKIGQLMNNDQAITVHPCAYAYDNPVVQNTSGGVQDRSKTTTAEEMHVDKNIRSMLTLDLHGDGSPPLCSPIDGAPRRSIEDSPLDLPHREQLISNTETQLPNLETQLPNTDRQLPNTESQLPNVLLDT